MAPKNSKPAVTKDADKGGFKGNPIEVNDDTVVIGAFTLGKDMALVSVTTYRDKTSLDIRRYYLSSENERWCPTSKGIRLEPKAATELLNLLVKERGAIEKALA